MTLIWTREEFLATIKCVFGGGSSQTMAAQRLLSIKQGSRSVLDYSIEFHTIATQSRWTELSLAPVFYHGLQDVIKDELVHRIWDANPDKLIKLACNIEEHQRERSLESRGHHAAPQAPRGQTSLPRYAPTSQEEEPEPMQVGRSCLSAAERARHFCEGQGLYCGKRGHIISICSARPPLTPRGTPMPFRLRVRFDGPGAGQEPHRLL